VPLVKWLSNAVEMVFETFDEKKVLQDAIEQIRDRGPFDPGESTAVIVDGLEALIGLIRKKPEAYNAVVVYRKTFETALWEIDLIGNYKELHDNLHKVQLNWPPTSMVFLLLPQWDTSKQILLNYSAMLNEVSTDLRNIYEKGYVDGDELTWIDELKKYQADLEQALTSRDALPSNGEVDPVASQAKGDETIKDCFSFVRDLLSIRLPQLNNRLKSAINALHLTDLRKAMESVCMQITTLSPQNTAEQIKQYKLGVVELAKLEANLKELIKQHDAWQNADSLLRTMGLTLKKASPEGEGRSSVQEQERLFALNMIKSMIDTAVIPLLTGKNTLWATRLISSAQQFNLEVKRRETVKAEQAFDVFREQAWHLFFEIDTEMKKQCEELRSIGVTLRKINEQFRFDEDWIFVAAIDGGDQ